MYRKYRANGFRKASYDFFGEFDNNYILRISKNLDKHLEIQKFIQKLFPSKSGKKRLEQLDKLDKLIKKRDGEDDEE